MTNMPPVPAREAATVMLIRDGLEGIEVFMVLRHEALAFASGALVFPGGSVDQSDRRMAEEIGGADEGMTDGSMPAALIAAIRETFEECGILLARPAGCDALVTAERLVRISADWRTRLARSEVTLADMLRVERLSLATDCLVPFAHWITPEAQPKRFDTRFLLAAAPLDQIGAHDGHEAVDSLWIAPERAVSRAQAGEYKLVFATQLNLLKLAQHRSVMDALAAARASDIVTVTPVQENSVTEGVRHMRIPSAAGYGGELFIVTMPPASSA
jgi:8-oxo-dGTP pyrophosphatase MutT (NUDIX family)